MIVIGTAGHIDHGKSAVVKRLTGTDPDRLPEEKARGLTIDLGFAFYNTPDGQTIALVDVPGHERFVKNMIAGAGGIDAVMLVVAADDGWMPQSEEHFQVVRLLGVTQGLIVVNKIDLVEPDWLELLKQDIREKVRGSFLDGATMFSVSAQTGEGIDALAEHLNTMPDVVASRKDIGKARLYVDRSFIRPGIGGVVTGTLRGGGMQVGQTVAIWPSDATGKIRSLQSNSRDVETALPGQRTAVSFTGVDRQVLVRGSVVSARTDLACFRRQPVLALAVELLNNAPIGLADRRRVLLIAGTAEIEGELRLFRRKQLKPGESGIAFFRPDDPLYTLVGDHFIMRLPTPMVTLGGGQVLDHLPYFPRRRSLDRFDYLEQRLSGQLDDLVLSELKKKIVAAADRLLLEADYAASQIEAMVNHLASSGRIASFSGYLYEPATMKQALDVLAARLGRFLDGRPHLKGIPLEQVLQLAPFDSGVAEVLVRYALKHELLTLHGDEYNLAGRGMSLKGPVKAAYEEIMAALKADPYAPPKLAEFTTRGKNYREAIRFILDAGEGHKCGADFIFLTEVWDSITGFVRQSLVASGSLAVTELREHFGFTRKFVIPILEETDRLKLTRRDGDVRVKGERFEE